MFPTKAILILLFPAVVAGQHISVGYTHNSNREYGFKRGITSSLHLPLQRSDQPSYFELLITHHYFYEQKSVREVPGSAISSGFIQHQVSYEKCRLTGMEIVYLHGLKHAMRNVFDVHFGVGGGYYIIHQSIEETASSGVTSSSAPSLYTCTNILFPISKHIAFNFRLVKRNVYSRPASHLDSKIIIGGDIPRRDLNLMTYSGNLIFRINAR